MTETARTLRSLSVFVLLAALVVVLPLLMGNRTPMTLTTSGLVLVSGALLVALAGFAAFSSDRAGLEPPPTGWWIFAGVLTGWVALQVLPLEILARVFGPYPEALWQGEARPGQWSPNPAYTLRAWGTFVALMAVAWAARSMNSAHRNLLWLVIAASALFQALYGLYAHAANSETIFGVWPRHNIDFVHGSFSNRNLFAGYLALTWPLVIAVWWRHEMPGLKKLPFELRVAGSVISGAIIGAALLGSASRLGSAAGLAGLLVGLVLWTRFRARLSRVAVWPMYATAFAALVAATWYGLTPLAERLAVTSIEEGRFEVYGLMLGNLATPWWLTGVGLGGFEAVFKGVQPGDMGGWYDYAHNDLLQWLLEMGLVGAGLLAAALVALWRNARLNRETIPLYAGLAAQALVALGDFSWHIPATQVVLAVFVGVLLRDPKRFRKSARSGVKLRTV
ncbi:MAG: O-antigen ligase family protein [Candidatus Wenzhouxiangella sp. M2_3B_020]